MKVHGASFMPAIDSPHGPHAWQKFFGNCNLLILSNKSKRAHERINCCCLSCLVSPSRPGLCSPSS